MTVSYDKLWVILNERNMMKNRFGSCGKDQYQCNGKVA